MLGLDPDFDFLRAELPRTGPRVQSVTVPLPPEFQVWRLQLPEHDILDDAEEMLVALSNSDGTPIDQAHLVDVSRKDGLSNLDGRARQTFHFERVLHVEESGRGIAHWIFIETFVTNQ